MANWCKWCSCSCSPRTGRLLAYLTDLVMAIFVTTLTATLLPIKDDPESKNATIGVSNTLSFIALLIHLLAVLHLGSIWSSVLEGVELLERPKLRLWFIATGLIFGFYHWGEEYRCAFVTILLIYYFISLLLTHTLREATAINAVLAEGEALNANANHELKEVKTTEPEAQVNAELVEVALNDSGAHPSPSAAAMKPEGENLELK